MSMSKQKAFMKSGPMRAPLLNSYVIKMKYCLETP